MSDNITNILDQALITKSPSSLLYQVVVVEIVVVVDIVVVVEIVVEVGVELDVAVDINVELDIDLGKADVDKGDIVVDNVDTPSQID